MSSHGGLIMISMSQTGAAAVYFAPLDDAFFQTWLPFDRWWNEIIFVDNEKREMSRRDLVRSIADQDGGAHVDPALSETYAHLSRHNSMGWKQMPGDTPIPNPEKAAIRQISHEVLKTLDPQYKMKPNTGGAIIMGGTSMTIGDRPPPIPRPMKIGRNSPCPCGSKKKYKKCHGAI